MKKTLAVWLTYNHTLLVMLKFGRMWIPQKKREGDCYFRKILM